MTFETLDIPIKSLKRNTGQIPGVPKNPRIIKDNNFKKLKDSIVQDPEMLELREIIAYKQGDDYIIIGGNMRFEALKALNFEKAKCKVITGETTPEQLKRIILKDNSAYGEWDFDELANEWEEALLNACAIDIPVFDEPKLEDEVEEDEFDETKETILARCSKGDIWQLGDHRLMCGDSTDGGAVALLMNGEKADLLFTDPPYNVNIEQKKKKILHCNEYNKIENDNLPPDQFKIFLNDIFKNAHNSLKETASYYVFSCQGGDSEMMMMMMRENGIPCRHQIIWVKDAPVFSMGRLDYDYKHEPILYGWVKRHTFYRKGEQDKSVWTYARTANKLHPTMKPVELIANALKNSTIENNIVLDLFGGSGSTLIACEQLNRTCYAMEIDPHYCDVIIARWEKLTGRQAVKLGNINEMPKTEGTNNQNRD